MVPLVLEMERPALQMLAAAQASTAQMLQVMATWSVLLLLLLLHQHQHALQRGTLALQRLAAVKALTAMTLAMAAR